MCAVSAVWTFSGGSCMLRSCVGFANSSGALGLVVRLFPTGDGDRDCTHKLGRSLTFGLRRLSAISYTCPPIVRAACCRVCCRVLSAAHGACVVRCVYAVCVVLSSRLLSLDMCCHNSYD
ncbi:hypothetical protein C8Q80DRAFT_1190135 [Daedaleopsis nitida]|nr:hypothetical protein C8Q80DRAFT_1190135 [Daedaleopsis nitida]